MQIVLKRIKVFVILLAILFGLLIGAQLYINRVVKSVLYEQFNKFSENNYSLKVKDIHVSILLFNVTIDDLNLKHVNNPKDTSAPYVNIKSNYTRLTGINLLKLIFNRTLTISKFELVDPKIDIYYNSKYQDTITTKALINSFAFQISKLKLKNVQIYLTNLHESTTYIKAKSLNYNIKKQNLDIVNLVLETKNFDSSKSYITINTGSVQSFSLNQLINKQTFHYSKIVCDNIGLNMVNKNNSMADLSEKTEKIKTITRSKFFTTINPIAIKQMKVVINNGNRKLAFQGHEISYGNRNFSMKQFKLDVYQNFVTQLVSKSINITGLDADSINNGYSIYVNGLELLEPKINLILQSANENLSSETSILTLFSIKKINTLALKKGTLTISSKTDKYLKGVAKNIEFKANNVATGNGLLFFDQANFKASSLFYSTPNHLYNLCASQIVYSQKTGEAKVSNFKLSPNYSKATFGVKIGRQVARVDMSIKEVSLNNFDILNVFNNQQFNCDKVIVNGLFAEFFKDKNIPLKATDYRKFPQELLRELKYGLKINTLVVMNSMFKVEVLSSNADRSGIIEFDKINMLFKGIDNTSTSDTIELIFNGRLAKIGVMNAHLLMPFNDLLCNHIAHIEIGKMPFNHLNKILNDVAHVTVSKGQLDRVVVDITGNKKRMRSKMKLEYHDLEMKILADESTTKSIGKLKFANKLANVFIYNSNPSPNKPIRLAETTTLVEYNKFIINNWVAAALNGMLVTTAPGVMKLLRKN